MAEPVEVGELGVYVSALKLPRVPDDWPRLLASWQGHDVGTCIQVVDAESVAGLPHILFAVFNAASAFRYGYNKLRRLEAELLLVLSGTDRFPKAVELVGAKAGRPGVAIVVANGHEACAHSSEQISSSIDGSDALQSQARDEAMMVATSRGSGAGSPALEGVDGFPYRLVEEGALIYC